MRIQIAPTLSTDNDAVKAAEILRKCVHCGFCNATCPTYRQTGDELQGPRGRIYLIKGLLERDEVNATAKNSLDLCLTCRACETTCPSGVEYGELAEFARQTISSRTGTQRFQERFMLRLVTKLSLFRILYRIGRLFRFLLPKPLRELLHRKLPKRIKSVPSSTGSVVLLQGCVQRVMTPEVVNHLQKLLRDRDVDCRVASEESCCGSLHLHSGQKQSARALMASNVKKLGIGEEETVISSASGCGVTLKEYGRILEGNDAANLLSDSMLDASEFLRKFEFEKRRYVDRVAFQAPCTLQHGQRVTGIIEEILRKTGYEVVPVRDAHQCCGSSGIYSLLQPDSSQSLRGLKIERLLEASPSLIATANVGCQLHLESATELPVVHWIELLA